MKKYSKETYQQCNACGSTDIDRQSGAMGVHTCNGCGSGASISWKERTVLVTESRNLVFHTDPGHGWLEVQYTDLLKLCIDQEISGYSYSHQGCVYLEEDCDAGIFINAAKKAGWEITMRDVHLEKTPIRNYRSYRR